MDIRTIEAPTMKEALARVRAELGPDAVILQSREVSRRRLLGLVRASAVEITAGTGLAIAEKQAPSESPEPHPSIVQIQHQLDSLRSMVADLCRRKKCPTPDLPAELISVYTDLLNGGVDEPIASEVVCRLRDELPRGELAQPAVLRTRLAAEIRDRLVVSGPIVCEAGQSKVVALVGPTGAGKTAAVAKLAANFKLRQNLRVGLVTVDTYRIAAVEQLRTYAEIIDVPMKVVTSPREMAAAIADCHNCDLVLVDTTGRNPRDQLRIKELKAFLQEAAASEIHLVLSAVDASSNLLHAVHEFKAIGANRLLFTKLDEAVSLGGILSCVVRTGQPISYLSMGQDVPDNIDVADAGELAEQIVASLATESPGRVGQAA